MCSLPWPGIELVSFALQGGFLTTRPPGKPPCSLFWLYFSLFGSCPLEVLPEQDLWVVYFSSVQFSRSVVSDSLQLHGLQHAMVSLSITNSTCPQSLPVKIDDAVPLESGPLSIWYRKSGCSIIWWRQVLLLTHFWITVLERRYSRARDQGLFRQLTVEGPPHHSSYHSYREFSFRRKEQDLNVNTYCFFLFIKLRTMPTMKN